MTMVTDRTRQRTIKKATYRRSCLVCSMEYNYVPAGKDKGHEHKRGLFCSQACRSKHIADSKPAPFSLLFLGACKKCGVAIAARKKREYCGLTCRPVMVDEPRPPMPRECKHCGAAYIAENTGGKHSQYCGPACRTVAAAALKRIAKAERKAKLAQVTIERVDPYVVFDRDGWRCQLCGRGTPESKRGSYDDDAPELDHVLPIARGGAHSYDNTQCACRRCNQCKADKIVERKYYLTETLYL